MRQELDPAQGQDTAGGWWPQQQSTPQHTSVGRQLCAQSWDTERGEAWPLVRAWQEGQTPKPITYDHRGRQSSVEEVRIPSILGP